MKTCFNLFVFLLLWPQFSLSQNIEISGQIISDKNVENIHIINKTQKKYTVSDAKGMFLLEVTLSDTLVFSSVQHKLTSIILSNEDISTKHTQITLESQINELEEVIVGEVLTGDLLSDLKNSNVKPKINFNDVGISGYIGKPKTQSERLLYEAGEFEPKMLLGLLMGGIPLNPILNGLSGRTRMLKQRVKLEKEEQLLYGLKSRLGADFFKEYPLEEDLKTDFFYFCLDDPNFTNRCENSDLEALIFFKEKYDGYLENHKAKD